MAMNVDSVLRLSAKVDGLNGIVAFNRGLQSVETTAKGVTGAMRGMTGAAAGLSGALGALAPLLSVAGLVGLVQNTIKAGDAMYDLSQRTGVSVQALAQFRKAAATSGTDIENVSKSLVKLSKTMLEASTGSANASKTFQALGINIRGSNGQLKSADAVMLEVANRFKEMPDGVAKTSLALRLFGKSGAEMIPMLNMGGTAIQSLSVKMTEAFAKKADEYSDKLAILSGKVGALAADLTIALLPALQSVTDAVTGFVTAFNALPDVVKNMVVAGAGLAVAWGPITGILSGVAGGITLLGTAFTSVTGYISAVGISLEGLSVLAIDAGFALASVPIAGWIAAAVAGLAALSVALYQNNEGFRNWATTSLNFIKVLASDGINTMRAFGQTLASMWSGLVGAAKSVGRSIASAFGGPFGVIASIAKSVFDFVAQKIQGLYNLLPAGVRKAIGGVGNYFQGAWDKASGMASGGSSGGNTQTGGGFSPDLSALNSGGANSGSRSKDDSKRIQEGIRASAEALAKAKAELAILRQTDPIQKILLEYAEKRRVVNADANKQLAEKIPLEQAANIERTREAELDKLAIEQKTALTEKYKELGAAAYEAALNAAQFGVALDSMSPGLAGIVEGINNYISSVGNLREQMSRLTEQMIGTLQSSLSTAMSSAVSNFISGAESIQQTLSDMFKSIGDAFIKMATDIIAQQLIIITLNSIAKVFGGGGGFPSGSKLLGNTGMMSDAGTRVSGSSFGLGSITDGASGWFSGFGTGMATGGVMSSNGVVPLKRYATGGIAKSPQLAVFGERGPEAYVPLPDGRSIPVKVSGAMDRYRPVGGGTTAAAEGDAALGTDASGPVDGAIDVRYTVERINNVEYVTAEQFQVGMRQAASQGAAQGERRALKTLQGSRSVRSRVGLR